MESPWEVPAPGHICPDGRHDEEAAALYLGVRTSTLRTWRAREEGPAYVKAGRVWYYREDMDRWLRSRRFDPADWSC